MLSAPPEVHELPGRVRFQICLPCGICCGRSPQPGLPPPGEHRSEQRYRGGEALQKTAEFADPEPDSSDKDFMDCLNPDSLEILQGCKLEAALSNAKAPDSFQFMRLGYFTVDNKDSAPDRLVFNRSVSLKDSFKAK